MKTSHVLVVRKVLRSRFLAVKLFEAQLDRRLEVCFSTQCVRGWFLSVIEKTVNGKGESMHSYSGASWQIMGRVLAGSVWHCIRITVQSHCSVFGVWCSLLCAWCPDSCRVELKHLSWSTFLVLLFLGGRTVLVHAGCVAEVMQLVSNLLNYSWCSVSDCKWQICTFSLKKWFWSCICQVPAEF